MKKLILKRKTPIKKTGKTLILKKIKKPVPYFKKGVTKRNIFI